METNNKQRIRSGDGQRAPGKTSGKHDVAAVNEVAPGVPIVRSSTPKPLSFGMAETPHAPVFPSKAPSAPPLPEELDVRETDPTTSGAIPAMPAIPLTARPRPSLEESQEFIWLFEYGLEMDPVLLNSPERLNGVAMLYGPALLKGYALVFGCSPAFESKPGQFVTTIVSSNDPLAEVWGVLYRIPRRMVERHGNDPSVLDTVHAAATPLKLFEPLQVIVRERYRDRDITVTTYAATDALRQRLARLSREGGSEDALFMQRVAATARKQRLPETYIEAVMPVAPAVSAPPSSQAAVYRGSRSEKDTDPLPAWREPGEVATELPALSKMMRVSVPVSQVNPWLTVFALYLIFVLAAILIFAFLQAGGFGNSFLTKTFMPLGVPWLVLVYGLLGGCVSCLIGLGRVRMYNPPVFLVLTWFTRPYIGLVLAMLVYLLLNSGLFNLTGNAEQHTTGFLFAGALAGLCEGWLFLRRK